MLHHDFQASEFLKIKIKINLDKDKYKYKDRDNDRDRDKAKYKDILQIGRYFRHKVFHRHQRPHIRFFSF